MSGIALIKLEFMGAREEFAVTRNTTISELLLMASSRFGLDRLKKKPILDIIPITVKDNREYPSLKSVGKAPLEFLRALESEFGFGKFDLVLRNVDLQSSPTRVVTVQDTTDTESPFGSVTPTVTTSHGVPPLSLRSSTASTHQGPTKQSDSEGDDDDDDDDDDVGGGADAHDERRRRHGKKTNHDADESSESDGGDNKADDDEHRRGRRRTRGSRRREKASSPTNVANSPPNSTSSPRGKNDSSSKRTHHTTTAQLSPRSTTSSTAPIPVTTTALQSPKGGSHRKSSNPDVSALKRSSERVTGSPPTHHHHHHQHATASTAQQTNSPRSKHHASSALQTSLGDEESKGSGSSKTTFAPLTSPRIGDSGSSGAPVTAGDNVDESDFVQNLDRRQIKKISERQYSKLVAPSLSCQYRDLPGWSARKELRDSYDAAIKRWNESGVKPAIEFLTSKQFGDAECICQFITECPQLDRGKLGVFLTDDDKLSNKVLELYIDAMELADKDLLHALRAAVAQIRMPSDRLTRYLEAFAKGFVAANKHTVKDAGRCFTVCYALLTLNTAAHHPQASDATMSIAKFISFLDEVRPLEEKWLTVRASYDSVVADEIRMPSEGLFCDTIRRGWLEYYDATSGLFSGGAWKRRWTVLSGGVLYLLKDPDTEPLIIVPLRDMLAMSGALHGREFAFALYSSAGDSIAVSERDDAHKPLYAHNTPHFVMASDNAPLTLRWVHDINEHIEQNAILVPSNITGRRLTKS